MMSSCCTLAPNHTGRCAPYGVCSCGSVFDSPARDNHNLGCRVLSPPAPARVGLDFEKARQDGVAAFCARFSCTPEDIKTYEESLFRVGVWMRKPLNAQCLALVEQARAEYAPLLRAVREWQEARKAVMDAVKHGTTEADLLALNEVEYAATLALASLPLPEDK